MSEDQAVSAPAVDVAAIRAALAKATPGPWILSGELVLVAEPRGWTEVASCLHDSTDTADAELIVLLRNNAGPLLDALAEAEAKVERLVALRRCSCMAEQARQRRGDSEPAVHRPYCREYVGPLNHSWVRTSYNETFGGLDHWCSCGGWFRQGGFAGHGDGSETAEPVCPRAHLAETPQQVSP